MVKLIKSIYKNSDLGRKVFFPIKWCYDYFWVRIASETSYLKRLYKLTFNLKLNLENPKTIQEKYLWLRLNEKTALKTLCADKYLVRNYIKDRIGEEHLIPLILHTTEVSEIVSENLPDYPFIIKTNHGCGGHVTVKDKSKIDWNRLQKYLKKSLKSNFYYKSREWQYKNIIPRVIVEELILNDNQRIRDHKFHCYNGTVNMIEVYIYEKDGKKSNFYTKEWEKLEIHCRTLGNADFVKKPQNLKTMISLAEELSTDFRFVRVDMYNNNGNIYIGELTFNPAMGLQGYLPDKWSLILGEQLHL